MQVSAKSLNFVDANNTRPKVINKSLIPTFGLSSSHYYHTFAKD